MINNSLVSKIGPIMQLAFVPSDFEAAVKHWTENMGVGPFFWIEHAGLDNAKFNGQPSHADFGLALAYWGDIQIELIKQHNDAPSIYNTQPWAGSGGLHHVCLLTENLDDAKQKADAAGAKFIFTADVPGGGGVFYADCGSAAGLVEVLQPAAGSGDFFKMVHSASQNWDGSDPFRPLG